MVQWIKGKGSAKNEGPDSRDDKMPFAQFSRQTNRGGVWSQTGFIES